MAAKDASASDSRVSLPPWISPVLGLSLPLSVEHSCQISCTSQAGESVEETEGRASSLGQNVDKNICHQA